MRLKRPAVNAFYAFQFFAIVDFEFEPNFCEARCALMRVIRNWNETAAKSRSKMKLHHFRKRVFVLHAGVAGSNFIRGSYKGLCCCFLYSQKACFDDASKLPESQLPTQEFFWTQDE
jgi:hypothetical protein